MSERRVTPPGQGRTIYDIDLILCIDGTGSMQPTIQGIKEQALRLPEMMRHKLETEKNAECGNLHVKVIVFRDYAVDGKKAMVESEFFKLSDEDGVKKFQECVNKIEADGGGDLPENALEAIALALKSEWHTSPMGHKRRQGIILFTDADAHQLMKEECTNNPDYPAAIVPENHQELMNWFRHGLRQYGYPNSTYSAAAGRLIVFAPMRTEEGPTVWSAIQNMDSKYKYVVNVNSNEGGSREDYERALDVFVKSC